MTDPTETVRIPVEGGDLPGQVWLPEGGTGPGIVLFQEIFGVSAYIRRRAADLAGLGYVVLAPTFYWRMKNPDPIEGENAVRRAAGRAQGFDWPVGVNDGAAAVRWLRGQERTGGRTAAVGFCFGGGLSFNVAAVEPVDALVSYYGSAIADLLALAPGVRCPSLYHFGLKDSYVSVETIRQIEAAVTARPGAQFHVYEGADHAFDNSDLRLHHPQASAQAWATTVDFLRRVYPV